MSLPFIMLSYCIINAVKNRNCGGSYIDSLDWTENKKVTIDTINKEDKIMFSIRCNIRIKLRRNRKDLQRITTI